MMAAGIAGLIIGYAFLYSGLSNLTTGGKGWGFLKSLVPPKVVNGVAAGYTQDTGNVATNGVTNMISAITPQGNFGATPPDQNSSPTSGGAVAV